MPGPEVYHNSLKRCDLYDNPYNTRLQAHPAIIKQRQEIQNSDTIGSAQVKLEKEIFKTFQQNSLHFLSGKMFVIGLVGKYAFLAIMLPTYLFFYGIPKWLLTEAVPNIFGFSKRVLSQVGSKISSGISYLTTAAFAIIKTVTDPILNFIQTRLEQVREFYHNVKYGVERFARTIFNTVSSPFRYIKKTLFEPVQLFAGRLSSLIQDAFKTLRKIAEHVSEIRINIRNALIEFPEKLQIFLQELPGQIKNYLPRLTKHFSPLVRLMNIAKLQMQPFLERAGKIKDFIVKRALTRPAAFFQKALHVARGQLSRAFHLVADPILQWAAPKLEKTVKVFRQVKERIAEAVETVGTKVKNALSRVQEGVKDLSTIKNEIVQLLPQPVIAFFTPLAAIFSLLTKNPLKNLRGMRRNTGRLAVMKAKVAKTLAGMNMQMLSFFNRSFQKAKPVVVNALKKSVLILKKAVSILMEMLRGALFLIRLMLAWFKVLVRQGMLLVSQTCSTWLPKLR
jgi:phage-related protein